MSEADASAVDVSAVAASVADASVVDASVWVSLFVGSDAHHDAATAWFEKTVAGGAAVVAPSIVLSEIAGAIARRTGHGELGDAAVRLATAVPGLRLVDVDRHVAMHSAGLAASLRLRGADALYVAVADMLSMPLITWDAEQVERTDGVVAAQSPDTQP